MKKTFILFSLIGLPLFAQEQLPPSITLKDCYQLAVKQSESIAITDELIKQAEAQYNQALGNTLPEFYFGYDSTWQDKPPTTTTTPGSFFISPTTDAKIGARKTLFTGYKELAAINAGSSFLGQRKDEKNRALQLLLGDVATVFYGALQSEADLRITIKGVELLQDRLKETRQRASVGRSRGADVLALESQIQMLQAQQSENERLAAAQRDLLAFFIGQPVSQQLQPSEPIISLQPVTTYTDHVEQRPDIQAQEKAVDVAIQAVRAQRSLHFPSLDLYGNYYLDRQGYKEGVDWDASIVLEFPIWSWGATQGAVNSAKAYSRQQRYLADELKRRGEIDVQTAYRNVTLLRQQNDTYDKARNSARKEHLQTIKDYRNGLINTFDVLESLDRLYQAERAFNLSELKARLAEVSLKITAGYVPEEILE